MQGGVSPSQLAGPLAETGLAPENNRVAHNKLHVL